jgi:SAM-dependent methyltransferase
MDLPLYRQAKNIDGCNFNTFTVWEGSIKEGLNYNYYANKKGYQYIGEASDLKDIENEKYDFLLASHCLEHCANPLKTIQEWLRVIRPGGCLLLILPDKRYTFDHKRPVTPFAHLLDDYNNNADEKDLTHVNEILELHDLAMDKAAGTTDQFRQRSLNNYENRCLHHHVFDFPLLQEIYTFFKIETVATRFIRPYHQVIAGIKK